MQKYWILAAVVVAVILLSSFRSKAKEKGLEADQIEKPDAEKAPAKIEGMPGTKTTAKKTTAKKSTSTAKSSGTAAAKPAPMDVPASTDFRDYGSYGDFLGTVLKPTKPTTVLTKKPWWKP